MYTHSHCIRRSIVTLALIAALVPATLAAKETVDYYELAASGTTEEIASALNRNASLKSQVFGDNRETFLMLALREDRPLEVINAILKADSSPTAKAKDKRTPLMFAAQYSSDPAIIDKIVSYGTVLGIGKKGRVTAKDSAGHTSFYYARLNPNQAVYQALLAYAKDPEPAADTESAAEPEAAQETASPTTKKTVARGGMATATYVPTAGTEDDGVQTVTVADELGSGEAETEEETGTLGDEAAPEETASPAPEAADAQEEPAEPEEPPAQEESNPLPESEPEEAPVTAAEIPERELPAAPQPGEALSEAPAPEEVAPEPEDLPKAVSVVITQPSPYLYDYAVQAADEVPEESPAPVAAYIENPDQADENGVTLLMKAAKAGNDWDVQALIASGADVNVRDSDGWSALMYAVRYQNSLGIVQALVAGGAHLRIRNKYNATPLLIAADWSQNPGILSLLLEGRSASEDEVYKAFIMAITSTAGSDHIKQAKVRLFLDMGISVNRVWKGRTPLMYAAEYCDSTAVLKMLLDEGARTQARDADSKTAFDYAKANRRLPHDEIYWSLNEGVGY